MKQFILTLVSFFALTSSGWCGLVLSFDPTDLSVTSTGANQIVDLGILIAHDGVGEDTLSGFTLDYNSGDPALTAVMGSGAPSDFTWAVGRTITPTSIIASNFSNHSIDTSGTQLLGTLQFTLDGSFTSGMIPIDLTFNSAQRGNFPTVDPIPASEITVTGGILNVSAAAVPEPGSLAMMGIAACGALSLYRRRRLVMSSSKERVGSRMSPRVQ